MYPESIDFFFKALLAAIGAILSLWQWKRKKQAESALAKTEGLLSEAEGARNALVENLNSSLSEIRSRSDRLETDVMNIARETLDTLREQAKFLESLPLSISSEGQGVKMTVKDEASHLRNAIHDAELRLVSSIGKKHDP